MPLYPAALFRRLTEKGEGMSSWSIEANGENRRRWRTEARRRVERILLALPLIGRVGTRHVVLRDLSVTGCQLEHDFPLKIQTALRLTFSWHGEEITLDALVVRCRIQTFNSGAAGVTVYQSGLRFQPDEHGGLSALRRIVGDEITRSIEEQKANARGDLPHVMERMALFAAGGHLIADSDEAMLRYQASLPLPYFRIARERGYVRYMLGERGWVKRHCKEPEQPLEGFTIWAHEDKGETDRLCQAYERGGPETRWLIRRCAELSLVIDERIPPQRFEP